MKKLGVEGYGALDPDPSVVGVKDDAGKPDFRTMMTYDDMGRLGAGPWKYGADKYGEQNYRGLFKNPNEGIRRLIQAAGRHVCQSLHGAICDEDTGVDHRYHALAELLMILDHIDGSQR